MRDIILTCAITGNLTRPDQTPYLPITPKQIADSSLRASDAGAAIVHLHVRHADGTPSMELDHYGEVMERIREQNKTLIINFTTGQGGRFIPDPNDPKIAAPGTSLLPPLARIQHVLKFKPDICTLDFNTMNSGDMIVMNTRPNTRVMAEAMLKADVKPEIEIFNPGDLLLANEHVENLAFPHPVMYSFVMGVKYGWPAILESIQLGKRMLPDNAIWTAFGVGPHEFPMVAQSVLLGGHIRVGLEDNLFLEKGVLAKENAELCDKACRIVKDLGYQIASAEKARAMLGL